MNPIKQKKAIITGVTGQDGSYLSEFLLNKGYEVHGIKRRSSSFNINRIDHLYKDPHELDNKFILHYGDLTDSTNLIRIFQQVQPVEIYNLGAQGHIAVSFETPEYTANSDALGTLRILEAIRILNLIKDLALKIANIVGFKGDILWDKSKPDGTPRKLLDISKILEMGWAPLVDLNEGIKKTVSFLNSYEC